MDESDAEELKRRIAELGPEYYIARGVPPKLLADLEDELIITDSKALWMAHGVERRRRECQLTKRETQALAFASHGLIAKQTAELLGIGYQTARSHLNKAMYVLAAKNTTHAVATAIRNGKIR